MSTAGTTHRRLLGPTTGSALAAAIVVGAVAALGIALPLHDSTQPAAPTSECTIESCDAGVHPLLPGRHDFGLRPGGDVGSSTAGGRPQLGQP